MCVGHAMLYFEGHTTNMLPYMLCMDGWRAQSCFGSLARAVENDDVHFVRMAEPTQVFNRNVVKIHCID